MPSLEALLSITPPALPSDFDAFWRQRYQCVRVLDAHPQIRQVRASGSWLIHDFSYTSTDDVRIGGWLLTPRAGPIRRALLIGHGYGGRTAPDLRIPAQECAVLFPCLRGISRSALQGVSTDPRYHVLHNIQDRNRYILGGCADDIWMGISALLETFPQVSGHIGYMGISFCGGMGALATPWDARIQRVHLALPTFGHHPLRLTIPCSGSGEAVRQLYLQGKFNITDTLAYYDAASAASFFSKPVHVAAALRDPAVPPHGQFAIYNAAPASERKLFVLEAGHDSYVNQAREEEDLFKDLEDFFVDI